MNVDFTNPIESNIEDLIASMKPYSLVDILTASGQVLGHNIFQNQDVDLNVTTFTPLIRVAFEQLDLTKKRDLTFEELRILCRKAASFNKIRPSIEIENDRINEDNKIDYIVRNEIFQGNLQEDMSLVLSRIFILLYDMKQKWGRIDPNQKIKETFGIEFHQLYIVFFGTISILAEDKSKFILI